MSKTNGTQATATATTEPATVSLLTVLNEEWVKAGSKSPDAKTGKALIAGYLTAKKAKESAEVALIAAQKAETEAVSAIIRANGKRRVKIGDVTYVPMARGETVYFRTEGGGEVTSLG